MDEQAKPERMVFTKSGESLSIDGLARKLKGAIFELSGEAPANDDDTALAALAAFDLSENITGTLNAEEIDSLSDDFCEAWAKV
jgi:hypothetical protein